MNQQLKYRTYNIQSIKIWVYFEDEEGLLEYKPQLEITKEKDNRFDCLK